MTPKKTYALVPAAGTGVRMGGDTKKQFLCIDGTPILTLTLTALAAAPCIEGIIVALPEDEMEMVAEKIVPAISGVTVTLVRGGSTRQESVKNAFDALPDGVQIVLTHDAVRPFIDTKTIEAVVAAVHDEGAATVALPITETVKRVQAGVVYESVSRSGLVRIQTPQAFRYALLKRAMVHADASAAVVTDEASLMELIGAPVRIVEGNARNIKVTTPDDIIMARALLREGS